MSRIPSFKYVAAAGLGFFHSFSANAKPGWAPTGNVLNWTDGSTNTVDSLDCTKSGYSGLIVTGTVTLVVSHPNTSAPQSIRLLCPYLLFRPGAQILTKEMMDLKISVQAVGPVKIINTRGENGADAPVDAAAKSRSDEIWKVIKEPKAQNGNAGGNGRNAETDFKGNWSADEGGRGYDGQHGPMRVDGVLGNPGGAGKNSARIQLRVADFADGATRPCTPLAVTVGPVERVGGAMTAAMEAMAEPEAKAATEMEFMMVRVVGVAGTEGMAETVEMEGQAGMAVQAEMALTSCFLFKATAKLPKI